MSKSKPSKKVAAHHTSMKSTIEHLEKCLESLRASREVFKQHFPQTYALMLEQKTHRA